VNNAHTLAKVVEEVEKRIRDLLLAIKSGEHREMCRLGRALASLADFAIRFPAAWTEDRTERACAALDEAAERTSGTKYEFNCRERGSYLRQIVEESKVAHEESKLVHEIVDPTDECSFSLD